MIAFGNKDDLITKLQCWHYPKDPGFFDTLNLIDSIEFKSVDNFRVQLGTLKVMLNADHVLVLEYLGGMILRYARQTGGGIDQIYEELEERLINLSLFDDNIKLECVETRDEVIEVILRNPWFFYIVYKNPTL